MSIRIMLFLLIAATTWGGEITVSELEPCAQEKTEPYFKDQAAAVPMTITESIYKTTPQGDLITRVYTPSSPASDKRRPCALFFYGGGWRGGSLLQFSKHCEYLVSRGFVAMTPRYRGIETHHTTPREAAEDALSCVRWVRKHADELHIDPDRILVGGGSAGGHLAAATATLTKIRDAQDDPSVSCRPNLLVLFNPAVNTGPETPQYERISEYWQEFSPMHNMQKTMPDTVIFHGLSDNTVPTWTAREFSRALEQTGAISTLYLYPEQKHAFFNEGSGNNPYFYDTMYRMGVFLEEQGWIAPETR